MFIQLLKNSHVAPIGNVKLYARKNLKSVTYGLSKNYVILKS